MTEIVRSLQLDGLDIHDARMILDYNELTWQGAVWRRANEDIISRDYVYPTGVRVHITFWVHSGELRSIMAVQGNKGLFVYDFY